MIQTSAQDPTLWIENVARSDPNRLWLIGEDVAETYGELRTQVAHMAGRLASFGVKAEDRVAAQIEKSHHALHLYLGCLWLGAVYLPLNNGYTAAEIGYFLGDAEPALFVVDPASPHLAIGNVQLATLAQNGSGTLLAKDAEPLPCARMAPDDLAAMLYTSGTTGKPKGAMLTRSNLASSAATLVEAWQFTRHDVLIHALPIFHVHGLFVATNTVLAAGASVHLLPKFDVDAVIDRFERATCLMGVPTFYTRLLASPRLDKTTAVHMRLFVSGSAPLLAETHREFSERTGHAILERYGMTETMMNTSNPYLGARVPGTVGPPLPGVSLRVAEAETGRMLPQGDIGMIEVKGPNVFAGYWRNPEKTAAEFREDGYFITGDLGKVDADGYVHIIGRGKDLIISGGLNIYPKEVEEAIDALPGVTESAVVGVADADFGEAVAAVIVGDSQLTAEGIMTGLREALARFKLPKTIIFVSELPRNTMGKVQKSVLRETLTKMGE
jgi:malonyl-CoA/methylmalonyl-CoA synthetase